MKKTCLLLLLIASIATTVHAQVGFEGGVNLANLAIKANGDKVATKFLVGATLGMFVDISVDQAGHFYLEPGVFYQTNGAKITGPPEWNYIINSGNLLLNLEYKSGSRCSQRFFAGIGPYIGDNINADSISYYLRKLDLGIGVNAGYVGKKHFYCRIRYQLGLINELESADSKNSIKQSAAGLTIGYTFRGCKRRSWNGGSRKRENNHWRGIKKGRWSTHQSFRRPPGPAY